MKIKPVLKTETIPNNKNETLPIQNESLTQDCTYSMKTIAGGSDPSIRRQTRQTSPDKRRYALH